MAANMAKKIEKLESENQELNDQLSKFREFAKFITPEKKKSRKKSRSSSVDDEKKAAAAANSSIMNNQIPPSSSSTTTTSSFSIPSMPTPQKEAAKFAAKQSRPHFKIEDPPSSRVKPISLLSEEDKRQVRLQRVKRYEAAPFATEHSLNLQRKQMSEIENQLGYSLEWREKVNRKNSDIRLVKYDTDYKNKDNWNSYYEWFFTHAKKFYNTFPGFIDKLHID